MAEQDTFTRSPEGGKIQAGIAGGTGKVRGLDVLISIVAGPSARQTSSMIKALAHVCITTKDLAATEQFYCGVLGLKKRFEFERDGRIFGFYVELNERNYIEFFENRKEEGEPGRQKIKHLAIEVENMDVLEKQLHDCDVKTWNKKLGNDGSWQMWCEDPNGVQIEFQQYTENSSQLTKEKVVM